MTKTTILQRGDLRLQEHTNHKGSVIGHTVQRNRGEDGWVPYHILTGTTREDAIRVFNGGKL